MSKQADDIKNGATEVTIKGTSYRVIWFNEPGEIVSEEERALRKPQRVHQLMLKPVEGKRVLTFHGDSQQECLEHLSGYIKREVANV